jgi:hypothetical protein
MRSRLAVPVLLLVALLLIVVARQPYMVTDWFRLRGYEPGPEITSIADVTTMTDKARHLFYINRPQILNKADFRKNCPKYDEQTIVIGCYESGQRGIHVLKVDDDRLNGVEEVTAAHEMLHAAYERLRGNNKRHVDELLQQYADTQLTDERIKKAMESYRKSEPGQELNEIHSMFGTEIADLPDELEAYYTDYFQDRSQVVAAADAYQDAFTSRQASISAYDAQLEELNKQIKADTIELQNRSTVIENDRKKLDSLRAQGEIDAYNAGVEPFNDEVVGYNDLLIATKQRINRYNTIVGERNAIAAQTLELQQAIDSSELPQSQ